MEETKARLFEELPEVCKDYCSISWAHALDAARIPADFALRLPEKVFFPTEIQEVPADTTEAFEQVTVVPNAIPLAEIAKGFGQVAVRGEDVEEEKGKGKDKGKKNSSKAKDPAKEAIIEAEDHGTGLQVKDAPPPQPEQKEDPPNEA